MELKHKVIINVTRPGSIRSPVIESQKRTIRSKILNLLLGEKLSLIVITPGESVETVEIKEIMKGC